MKKITIIPKGVSERQNKENGVPGECALLMNMRERNASLEVVGKWKEVADIVSPEQIILIDRRGVADYFISHRNGVVYVHGMRVAGVYTMLNREVCSTEGEVLWAQSVGDFVTIGTSSGIKYLYYDGSGYEEMKREDMAPQLAFKAVNVTGIAQKVPGVDFKESYSRWSVLEEGDKQDMRDVVIEAYKSLLKTAESKGAYIQPVAVRYAVRLWDDSYAWLSAPVIVGVGVQCQSMVSSVVDGSLSGCEDSAITANLYNIGVTMIAPPSKQWSRLIKSVDVLVSDELEPYVGNSITCRCESSSANYYITYGLPQRERSVAIAEIVNPTSWHVVAKVTDMDKLSDLSVVLRSKLYDENISRKMVADVTRNIGCDIVSNSAINLNGKLCSAGHRHVMRNAWKSAQYWGSKIIGQSCEVIITAKLRTINGDAVKVSAESYDYTPINLNSLITYPDSRAKELNIKILSNDSIKEWSGGLTGIDEQGMAYFVNPELNDNVSVVGYSFYEPTEQNTNEQFLTELTMSRCGNPFVIEQYRSVGQGEVINLAVAAKPIFSGVFGRYPIYAFATDGIYAVAYKNTGDYKDAQLISHRRIGAQKAIASSGEEVYFVSSQGEVCALLGKEVKVLGKDAEIKQLSWVDVYKELIVRHGDNTVCVYMPGGRRYDRDAGLRNVYGDFHDAIGEDTNGRLVDLNIEQRGVMPVMLEIYPIALNDGELIAPMQLTTNQVGGFAENAQINLLGSDGIKCEWKELITIPLVGTCCHRIEKRVYARPCRLVKLKLTGNAATGTVVNDYALKYN